MCSQSKDFYRLPESKNALSPVSVFSGVVHTGVLVKSRQKYLFGGFILMASTLAMTSGASAAGPTFVECDGIEATIVSDAEVVLGTRGDDVIVATGEGQRIRGLAGDDLICGSASTDVIFGGLGQDEIHGDEGADRIIGGAGDDVVLGDEGRDTLSGNSGEDSLVGGASADTLLPGSGQDFCSDDASDQVRGGCLTDSTAPEILDIELPSTVEAGTVLRVTFEVSDESGIASAVAFVGGASGWTEWCFGATTSLIAQTETSQTFEFECAVPENTPNDTYSLFVHAMDVFSNLTFTSTFGEALDFEIVGGSSDNTGPNTSNVIASYYAVAREVTVTWNGEDESGIQGSAAWLAWNTYSFASPQGVPYFAYSNPVELVSGTEFEGQFRVVIPVMDNAPDGEYTVWLSLRDGVYNRSLVQTSTTFSIN